MIKQLVIFTFHISLQIFKYGELDNIKQFTYINGPREKPWYINLAVYMLSAFLCMSWCLSRLQKSTNYAKFTYLKLIKLDPDAIREVPNREELSDNILRTVLSHPE